MQSSLRDRLSSAASPGERIRIVRKQLAYSLAQLAELSGFTHAYVSQIERGVRPLTCAAVKNIARHLELSEQEYRDLYSAAAVDYLDSKGWDTEYLLDCLLQCECPWQRPDEV